MAQKVLAFVLACLSLEACGAEQPVTLTDEMSQSLNQDDECMSSDARGREACSVNALQTRSSKLAHDDEQPKVDLEQDDESSDEYGEDMTRALMNVSDEEADTENSTYGGCPMVLYPSNYCTHCGEMAFCHRASNMGCGGHYQGGGSGAATFLNSRRHVSGQFCTNREALLTVPRSYIENIVDLKRRCGMGAQYELTAMLKQGYNQFTRGMGGEVLQCIHHANSVSVRWLHLHTFCAYGRVDGMPNGKRAYCAKMSSSGQAWGIAAQWLMYV